MPTVPMSARDAISAAKPKARVRAKGLANRVAETAEQRAWRLAAVSDTADALWKMRLPDLKFMMQWAELPPVSTRVEAIEALFKFFTGEVVSEQPASSSASASAAAAAVAEDEEDVVSGDTSEEEVPKDPAEEDEEQEQEEADEA